MKQHRPLWVHCGRALILTLLIYTSMYAACASNIGEFSGEIGFAGLRLAFWRRAVALVADTRTPVFHIEISAGFN